VGGAGELYLGLISGTSADGIDAALVAFHGDAPSLVHGITHPWPEDVRASVLALSQGEKHLDLDAFGRLDVAIGHCFADAANAVLAASGTHASQVKAIGSHGQTLRHRPGGEYPFTLQLGDPTVIAAHTGIDTVADFRRADVAAGGQGAPLVPALHAVVLGKPGETHVVLNLGGIANITVLGPDGSVVGFDTGPASALMDAWFRRHHGGAYDAGGTFAASGKVDEALLGRLLSDPYFDLPAPKSTGREYFHLTWLDPQLGTQAAADVQATLLELTTRSIAQAIDRDAPAATQVTACGGGVHNAVLMRRLAQLMPTRKVASSGEVGIDPDFVEAMAFAWLARRYELQLPGNLPAVTGARGPRVLGALHRAPRT
jgi:anhydro-N-acetylmuramic acid kinase